MSEPSVPAQAVAIIGMAGRFPASPDIDTFWAAIRDGRECITDLDTAALEAAGVDAATAAQPGYVRRAAVMDGVEDFDDAYFGITPGDAQLKDPQHKALLECSETALQDAGYVAGTYPGLIAIYASVGTSGYLYQHLLASPDIVRMVGVHPLYLHNEKDFAPTFVSYTLGLRGPSLNVNCGCSSSLAAVHLACRSLLQYETDIALAGAASILATQTSGYAYNEGGILSPDGHCRPFDAAAAGTLPGSGVGMVVLKRLEDAIADGDHIHAVIRGSAMNNDGRGKIGFTAPSPEGQARVIREALLVSEVDPAEVDYIEAHGTGTRLGDPIELDALHATYGAGGAQPCHLGSLKANIGHLNAASGVAGLIKATLSLAHGLIPPQVGFVTPNPALQLTGSRFRIAANGTSWPNRSRPRRAGISSFGIGGTNVHAVLEEAPRRVPGCDGGVHVLALSALDAVALERSSAALASHLQTHPGLALGDVAHTLQQGRRVLPLRRAVVARTIEEAVQALQRPDGGTRAAQPAARVAMLFPGQGSQYPGMAAAMHAADPAFRDAFDAGERLLQGMLPHDLRALLLQPGDEAAAERLRQTELAQPAIFLVSYALAKAWQARGLDADAMLGHSLGEYVAATLAGVFDLADALKLVVARGRMMQATPQGAMLSVAVPADALAPLLPEGVTIAAYNAPGHCVVAGTTAAIDALEAQLAPPIARRRLMTSHGFHSPLVEGAVPGFRAVLDTVRMRPAVRRFVSNITGDWVDAERCARSDYWVDHLRSPVRFDRAVQTLLASGSDLLLEVGPGQGLTSLARHTVAGGAYAAVALSSLGHPAAAGEEAVAMARAHAQLWCHGAGVVWSLPPAGQRRRVPLPTYPYQRRRHWVDRAGITPRPQAPALSAEAVAQERREAAPLSADALPSLLLTLCAERLGRSHVGPEDNFFDLGGDSLVATQLIAHLRAATGSRITLDQFLSAATLGEVVERVRQASPAPVATPLPDLSALDDAQRARKVPLSAAQQRMWFFERHEGGAGANTILTTARLSGPVDQAALCAAFEALVANHAPLRTAFFDEDGRPWQRVLPAATVDIERIEVAQGPLQAEHVDQILGSFAARPFDLAQGGLIRVLLVALGEDDLVLAVALHHIVGDSWSMGVLIGDLQAHYLHRIGAIAGPVPAARSPDAIDVAAWQQSPQWQAMAGGQLAYWTQALAGADTHASIADPARRSAERSFEGRVVTLQLDAALESAIAGFLRRRRTTRFSLYLAAYALLLAQESGAGDIVVGTDVANRTRPEMEGMIGFFVNLLALRVRLQAGEGVDAYLSRVQALAIEGHSNQDVPFDQVVAALALPRDRRFAPLFQHKLVLQNAPVPPLQLPGVQVLAWPHVRESAELDMVVTGWSNDAGAGLRIEYNRLLFDADAGERWLDKLCLLLRRLVEQTDLPVDALLAELRTGDQARRQQDERLAAGRIGVVKRRPISGKVAAQADRSEA
ncbi:type I polyketide synthase [Stenotrophomonas sp. LGBM10]|uniref:type I polyketide synthase n=1 Tax=Stenotrophomonas sp. LGBM10 TaxID=3390038 RepID=UPI00398BACBF